MIRRLLVLAVLTTTGCSGQARKEPAKDLSAQARKEPAKDLSATLLAAGGIRLEDMSVDDQLVQTRPAGFLRIEGDRYFLFEPDGSLGHQGAFTRSGSHFTLRNLEFRIEADLREDASGALSMAATWITDLAAPVSIKARLVFDAKAPTPPTPADLFEAATYGDVPATRAFLAAGSDAAARDDAQYTPLMVAARCCHAGVVKTLIQHGARVDDQRAGASALEWAARCGDPGTVREVLAGKPSLELSGEERWTPLFHAVMEGHLEAAQLIAGAGANLMVRDQHRNTLLHSAASGVGMASLPMPEIVAWLLEQKLPLEARDLGHRTPLLTALGVGDRATVTTLIAAGADLSVTDASGLGAKDYAEQHPELLPLLKQKL